MLELGCSAFGRLGRRAASVVKTFATDGPQTQYSVRETRPRKASCWREARSEASSLCWAGVKLWNSSRTSMWWRFRTMSLVCVWPPGRGAFRAFHRGHGIFVPDRHVNSTPRRWRKSLVSWSRVFVQVVTSRPPPKQKLLLPAASLAVIRCAPISSAGMCQHWAVTSCGVWTVISVCLVKGSYSFSASSPRTLQCADTCMLTSASYQFIHSVMAVIIHSSCLELSRETSNVVVMSRFGRPPVGEPGARALISVEEGVLLKMPPRTSGHVPELRQQSQPDGADRPDSRTVMVAVLGLGGFSGRRRTSGGSQSFPSGSGGDVHHLVSLPFPSQVECSSCVATSPHPQINRGPIISHRSTLDWALARPLGSGLRRSSPDGGIVN